MMKWIGASAMKIFQGHRRGQVWWGKKDVWFQKTYIPTASTSEEDLQPVQPSLCRRVDLLLGDIIERQRAPQRNVRWKRNQADYDIDFTHCVSRASKSTPETSNDYTGSICFDSRVRLLVIKRIDPYSCVELTLVSICTQYTRTINRQSRKALVGGLLDCEENKRKSGQMLPIALQEWRWLK